MKGNSPPPPPDPRVVAESQTKSNKETAIANAELNRFDQNSPFGSVKYNIVGYNEDGTPKYEQNTSLSDGMKGIFDSNIAMTQGMGDMGNAQLGQLQTTYGTPFNLEEGLGKQQFDMQKQLLDPVWDRNTSQAENRLVQKGFNVGSEGYTRGMGDAADAKSRAYIQAMLGSRGQAMNEAVAQRQMPMNEFNAMRTGTQVGMPQQSPFANVSQANTDIAGITQAGYQNQLAAAKAEQEQQNAMLSGLFGLGAAGITKFSDRRLKKNIVRTGDGPRGIGVYDFSYLWEDGGVRHSGYMADEVEAIAPWAVVNIGGFKAVNYSEVY